MVTYSAVARVSRSASTGPPGSTLGSNADHGHPPFNSALRRHSPTVLPRPSRITSATCLKPRLRGLAQPITPTQLQPIHPHRRTEAFHGIEYRAPPPNA